MTQKLDVTAYMKTAHWLKQYEIEAKKDGIHNKKTGELLVSFPFEIDPATAVLPSSPSAPPSPPPASGSEGGNPKKPKAGAEARGSEELPQPPSPPAPSQPPRSGEETSSP